MSKIAYFDCPTGIAGDMCLGALIHAGVPLTYLRSQLAKLGIKREYSLSVESVHRNQQAATKFHVQLRETSPGSSQPGQSQPEAAQPHDHVAAHHHDGAAHAAAHAMAHAEAHAESIARHHSSHSHSSSHSHAHDHHSEASHHSSDPSRQGHTHSHSKTSHTHSATTAEVAHGGISHSSHDHRHSHDHHRNLPEIERLIRQAQLPARAEAWSLEVFRNLAIAEATVHGTTMNEVHFHEVGAVDAIVDIVGTCLGLDYLDVNDIYCSALPTGGGTVWAAHGRLPVPAPAVLKLFAMGEVPVYGNGIERELVTPTGAAIAITLAQSFGPPPPMLLQTIGLGAGTIDLPIPNMVRLWIGESDSKAKNSKRAEPQKTTVPNNSAPSAQHQAQPVDRDVTPTTITLLQTQLDDISPQAIGYAFEQLLAAGALDVFTQAIAMKKNRPGILLTVICPNNKISDCEAILFKETSTLGIRRQPQQRNVLQRHWQTVTTDYGSIRIKVAGSEDHGENANVQPEYEDCAAIARTHNLPWRDVHQLALQAWHQQAQP